jgi:hypothetical protein
MSTQYRLSDSELNEELIHHLKRRELDQKFLYLWWWADHFYGAYYAKKGTKQETVVHDKSKGFFDYVNRFEANLVKVVQWKKFALISLGCGNSCQEKSLLVSLVEQSQDFVYIWVDSSQSMLELSKENLKDIPWLKMEFICADITSSAFLRNIKDITSNYESNIFSFLGRTFSNPNQTSITDTLYNTLWPNDYIWVDVLSRDPWDSQMKMKLFDRYTAYLCDERMNNFQFTPLKKVWVPFENWKMTLETSNENSIGAMVFTFSFLFTKKTVLSFKWETIHFLPSEKINLLTIRNYDWEAFINFFENHNFELINHEKGKAHGSFQMSHFVFKKADHN